MSNHLLLIIVNNMVQCHNSVCYCGLSHSGAGCVEAVPVPDGNTTAVGVYGGGVCTNKALLESLKVIVSES